MLRSFSIATLAAILVSQVGRPAQTDELNVNDQPPNVILILADDMAPGDFASRNDGLSTTPNLDRFAKESVCFQQAYSASCVCAPARAALLTGRYPHRTGVVTLNMKRYPDLTRLKHDETTIAEVLKSKGYATGLIGKWHCGTGDSSGPLDHGFDEFEGFSGSQELSYFRYALTVNERTLQVSDKYLTDDLSNRAIDFVERHRNKPFFLHLAHYAPHRPLEAPAERVASYRKEGLDESTATIYAMIETMDRGIGQLLAELDRLDLSERTIVIFASDNGPDPLTGSRFNGELRGTKYEVYEGGIRVPLMIRCPGRFRTRKVDDVVHFVDIFPTILELCKIEHTPPLPLDGQGFASLLASQHQHQDPLARYWQWNRGQPNYSHNAAVREGDWKLVRPYVTRMANPKDSQRKPVLYNLADDPAETRDLAQAYPERTRRMAALLTNWCQSVETDRVRGKPRGGKASIEADQSNSELQKEAGFASLFDGKTFARWKHNGNWTIEDGAFYRKSRGGPLTYMGETVPDDFEFRFEWKVSKGCNSGVYYRPGQVEYQILDNVSSPYGENARQSAASLFFCMAPKNDATRPVGQWNTGRVICKDTVIEHWLNGDRVISFDYTDPKWSEYVELLTIRGGDLTGRGSHLWLQDHGHDVWFRNLRWREIPDDEMVTPDPNFKPLPVTGPALEQERARVRKMLKAKKSK